MFIKLPNAQNKKGRSSYKYGVRLFLLSVRFSMDRFLFKGTYFRSLGAKKHMLFACAAQNGIGYTVQATRRKLKLRARAVRNTTVFERTTR